MSDCRVIAGVAALLLCGMIAADRSPAAVGQGARARQILQGRNIVVMQRCNECHTAGYAESGGDVPESRWLTGGDPGGLRGPWGVVHPPDLRAVASGITEVQWVHLARTLNKRPPMPQHNLSDMSDGQLKAVYWFIRSLGPGGGGSSGR